MAEYISFQPTDFFNTVLYTGNGTAIGSGGQAITGVGFQPDIVWAKQRSGTEKHDICDAVRGTTKTLTPNDYAAEVTNTETLTTFGADGFTVGNSGTWNTNTSTYVSWNWKAGTTSGLSGGTMTPVGYSINTTSGFGIYEYVGTAATATIAHGLGKVPKFVITKSIDAGNNWRCYHEAMGNTKLNQLNETAAAGTDANAWNSTTPTDTLFTLGSSNDTNASGTEYMAYIFCDVPGYSKFGSYAGNGNADGQFIYTGFRPAYFLIKANNGAEPWLVWNNKTEGFNAAGSATSGNNRLTVSSTAAEDATNELDIVSNGIKIRNTGGQLNSSSYTYIYAAFSEFPIVSSNDVPVVAR